MGWIANFLLLFGAWQIGHRKRWGFLLAISGSCIWASIGLSLERYDMIFIELTMSGVGFRNFWLWGKNRG